jgi:hypothetical protein
MFFPSTPVGYSKLSVNEQHMVVEELNQIVRASEQFQKAEAANRIFKMPTGDGMALVFYKSPGEPAQCAFEISRALKKNQRLQVRLGIHSGRSVCGGRERTGRTWPGAVHQPGPTSDGIVVDAGSHSSLHHVARTCGYMNAGDRFCTTSAPTKSNTVCVVSVTNLYSMRVVIRILPANPGG